MANVQLRANLEAYIGEWHEGAKVKFWQVRVHSGDKPHYLYMSSWEVASQFKRAFKKLVSFKGFDLGEITLETLKACTVLPR